MVYNNYFGTALENSHKKIGVKVLKPSFDRDKMFYKFSAYGFLKNLRFFDPFMILFFRETGLSFLEIGTLFAIRDLSTTFLEIPTGVYADSFGRRKSMVMAFVSYIASFVIFYFFSNYYLFIFAMFLFAFGDAFRSGTHKAMILEHLRIKKLQDVKVEYYGRTRSASQLGSAISSLIAGALVLYSGRYRYVFIASTIPYLINLFNLATYPKELDGEIKTAGGTVKDQIKSTLKDFFTFFKSFGTIRAILNGSTFDASFKVNKEYLQPIVQTFALSIPIFLSLDGTRRTSIMVGVVYFVIYMMTSYASRNASRVSKKLRDLPSAINITYIVGALMLLAAGIMEVYSLQIISIVLLLALYVTENLRRPMNVSYVSDQISHKMMASGLSVESQFTTILMAVLAPLAGFIADRFGVGTALSVMGILLLGMSFVVRVGERERKNVNA